MPVPTLISQLSTTASLNSPDGAVDVPSSIDDYQRAHAAFIAQLYAGTVAAPTVIVPSATTTDIGAAASENVDISGNTTITGFGTVAEGINRKGRFTGVLTLTHNATSLILPGNANITTANNDRYEAQSLGGGNWIVTKYVYANGSVISATNATTTTPIKLQCRAATTANITLAGSAPNTLDGVTLAANDRILVKAQSTGSQNGIYYVSTLGTGANGTWTRASDADSTGAMFGGMLVAVSEGTANGNSLWMLTTDDPITIGTTALTFLKPYADKGINADITSMTALTAINRTGGTSIKGTNTNTAAAAGDVGEYIESFAGPVSAPASNTYGDITSITLTAGDWDISAIVASVINTGVSVTSVVGGIGTAPGTSGAGLTTGDNQGYSVPPTAQYLPTITIPPKRVLIASTTTYYLKMWISYSSGTPQFQGRISARRVR